MKKIILGLLLVAATVSVAQDQKITIEDAELGYYKGLYPKNLYSLQWIDGTQHYIYNTGGSLEIKNAATGETVKTIGREITQTYPQLQYFPQISHIDSEVMVFPLDGNFQIYDYKNNRNINTISLSENAKNEEYNYKANAVAYTVDNNLLVATASEKNIPVTSYQDKNIVAGQAIHRSEFGIKKGTFWSPDGKKLAFYQKDETHVSDYPLVDIDTYPASLNAIKYPMAGQASERAAVGIFNLDTRQTIYLDIDTSDEHYLTNLTWTPDGKSVLIAEINRDQNHYELNRYDVSSGKKTNTLFEEKNSKWVEPEHDAVFLPKKNDEFLWFSERGGFMNLYHYNLNGKLIRQLTDFKWVVDEILGFDSDGKSVFISGTGSDAREKHTYRIELKNPKKITHLTPVSGTHDTQLSAGGNFLLDSYSSMEIPRVIDIVNTQNLKKTNILTSENPLENYAVGTVEMLTITAEDGTPLYGRLIKPKDFDPSKKYPVMVYVYGGPHAQLVTNSWMGGAWLWKLVFAHNEQYLVFTLDNRGSANRGFAFESIIYRQLGEVEMQDQLTGVEYLKSLPYVDASKMAVHGWSFGGFMSASLMLRHPEVFTTAVAGGTVTDWKFYEIMYGERYMDTPQSNPEGYEKSRVGNYVQNLKGKLMLIHDSADDVVVPQHAETLLKESVTKKQQVDYFLYPMHGHNVSGVDRVNLTQRIVNYILENNK
ncbi:MAG: DPP IV N-terminal domain-containing protein [Capnocytophaga sp.]|nr:DPP IV N-terminal domain-containing protein [Capnocytophaga sp.]